MITSCVDTDAECSNAKCNNGGFALLLHFALLQCAIQWTVKFLDLLNNEIHEFMVIGEYWWNHSITLKRQCAKIRFVAESFPHIDTLKLRMRVETYSIVEIGGLTIIKSSIINMIFRHKQYYIGKEKNHKF